MKKIDQSVKIVGLNLDGTSEFEVLNKIQSWIENSSKIAYIFTPNPEQVILAWRNPWFQPILNQARWLLPDGVGLVWASQFKALITGEVALERTLPGRVIAEKLLTFAQTHQLKVLLVGGRSYDSQVLKNLGVTWLTGYEDATRPTSNEEAMVRKTLTTLQPAIVLVAFGAPQQEKWLIEHQELLNQARVKIGMSVGGTFDVLTGRLRRPPQVVTRLGFEWLYRLVQEPWRWRRQSQLPLFFWIVLKDIFTRDKK